MTALRPRSRRRVPGPHVVSPNPARCSPLDPAGTARMIAPTRAQPSQPAPSDMLCGHTATVNRPEDRPDQDGYRRKPRDWVGDVRCKRSGASDWRLAWPRADP